MKQVLEAVADTMLPGGLGFPLATKTEAVDWLLEQPRFLPSLEALAGELPAGFKDAGSPERVDMLKTVEARAPDIFDAATVAIYSAYYTRPEVLAAIETARGYKAGPPQPGGYALPAFDPSILAVPGSRGRLWRDPEEEGAA